MTRPKWLALLFAALAVAAAFALLSQWQLSRAIESGQVVSQDTESVRRIGEVLKPATSLREQHAGQMVKTTGRYVPGDFLVVANRVNGGVVGYWVTGHLATDRADHAGLAVALGWTAELATAERVAAGLNAAEPAGTVELTGRLSPTEGPEVPPADADPRELRSMSVAALLGRWQDMDGTAVYTAFVVAHDPEDGLRGLSGLDPIDSPAPSEEVQLNWLNVFYAAEWVVFAGFAVFLWFRLAKDAWEREREEYEDALAAAAAPRAGSDGDAAEEQG